MIEEREGAAAIARAVASGEVSAVEVASSCLRTLDRLEPSVHAWEVVDPEAALRQASAVDLSVRRGEDPGPLCGVPIGVKDIFNTHDLPTQMGSPIWSGFTPGNDARVVHYLRMAGGVIPGKTVTAEFAVHTPGKTLNPHHPGYMTGTSSSGSAAAVAAAMVPVALGTQTAGSIVRPASYCGVYGLKPSFGLVPRTGMLKTSDSLDTVGGFARNAEDLRILLEVIRVRGADYPLVHDALDVAPRRGPSGGLWRVALVPGPRHEDAEPYARASLRQMADLLSTAGVDVDEPTPPPSLDDAHGVHRTIYDKALAYYFKEEYAQHTLVSPLMYEIIERGERVDIDAYRAALSRQAEIAADFDDFMANGPDVVITLSTGGEPLPGTTSTDRPDSCLVWTLCGAPTASVPVFCGPTGLPFGLQVVGRRYDDLKLLDFIAHLETLAIAPRDVRPVPALIAPRVDAPAACEASMPA